MKSEWEIGYIESSYSRGLRTFPPASSRRPRQTLEMFDFRFTFPRRKKDFFMHVLKKSYELYVVQLRTKKLKLKKTISY